VQKRGVVEADLLQELAFQELESGRHESARRNFKLALEGHERVSGKNHPHVLVVLEPLAELLREQGESRAAEAMESRAETLRRILADREQTPVL